MVREQLAVRRDLGAMVVDALASFTSREGDVGWWLLKGLPNSEIATLFETSDTTVPSAFSPHLGDVRRVGPGRALPLRLPILSA